MPNSVSETFFCYGHENVLAEHRSTIEFTTQDFLTKQGDCIIAINATKSLQSLSEELKEKMREKRKIYVLLEMGKYSELIEGYGHPELKFTSLEAMIIRKSDYTCPRTLMINANKAAKDLSRELIEELKVKERKLKVTIYVEMGEREASKQV